MLAALDAGDLAEARRINDHLIPLVRAIMTLTQGVIAAKAALQLLGVLDNRTTRAPLVDATEAEVALVRDALVGVGLLD
jgi:4-hydroxy-tetrahydrodipicolinate synthase